MPKNKGWFRLYDRMIDSPQVLELNDSEFRLLVSLWCLASAEGGNGVVPYTNTAIRRRVLPDKTQDEINTMLAHLIELDLLAGEEGQYIIPRWEQHQYEYSSRIPANRKDYKNKPESNRKGFGKSSESERKENGKLDTDTDTDTDIYTRLSNDNLDASRVAPVEPTEPPQNQASEDKEDKPDLSPPNGKELIAELVDMYRGIEGVTPTKGDYPFMGALYNEYGYAEVATALNELTMVMATEKIEKPLVYLKAILRKADRASPGPNKNRRMHGEVKANADPTREYKFKSLSAAE